MSEIARGARTTEGRILLGAMLLGGVAVALLAFVPGRVNHATLSDSVASAVSDAVTRTRVRRRLQSRGYSVALHSHNH